VDLLGGLIVVFGFLGLAKVFRLLERNLKVIEISRLSASIIGDNSLDDLQKEKALQKNAQKLLVLFLIIVGASIVSLGIPLGVIWLLDAINLLSFTGVVRTMTSTWFILTGIGISLIYFYLKRGKKEERSKHTPMEQTLHNLAFEAWFPRIPLSKIESKLYRKQLAGISVERPVFITALPRAGTTLTLKLCLSAQEFATHRYSDMPFLMTPLFWNRFSGKFRDAGTLRERVHGDGLLVNADSPESFEEILWKEYWPSYYQKDKIYPWSDASYPLFEAFFLDHMRKIIFLRREQGMPCRYISKNNLNIARTGYLSKLFPDATILVLFRSPLQQAASLLKQHRNFLKIHTEDSFARKYMEDTGHFDFGENLRPVDFKGWLGKEGQFDSDTLQFWLLYWINTYRYLLEGKRDQVRFFSFDALCADPQQELERLGGILDVKDNELLLKTADRIRQAKPHPVDGDAVSPRHLERAEALYRELQSASSS